MRKKEKDIKQINGIVAGVRFNFSPDERLDAPLSKIDGGGTESILNSFIYGLGLKDSIDFNDFIKDAIYQGLGLTKRDNLTNWFEKCSVERIIKIFEERLKNKNLNISEKEEAMQYIKDAKEIKKRFEDEKNN